MSDTTGYVEAAEILSTRQTEYDEGAELSNELPDKFRVVEKTATGEFKIEHEAEHAGKWVPIAKFTEPDAMYEWAEELDKSVSDEYRCVVDHTGGDVWLEVYVDE